VPLYRGPRYSLMPSAAPWWLAGGAISGDNCLEHVEYPSIGQLYVGASVADGNPWTIAVTTAWDGNDNQFIIDIQTGRIILGLSLAGVNGFHLTGLWYERNLFTSGVQCVYFLICTALQTQAYRNAVAIGSASGFDPPLSGNARWRSNYSTPDTTPWSADVLKAAVFDIALDTAQRTALYNTMR